ncbi:MAG: hypothetical protein ACRDZX_06845 [Acidimicrobiales bacterium]
MSYVIAAWASCGALLAAYAAHLLHRHRALRRSFSKDASAWR